MSRIVVGLLGFGLTLGMLPLVGGELGANDAPAAPRVRRGARPNDALHVFLAAQKRKTRKATPKKGEPADESAKPAPAVAEKDDGALKFSRDIAPILVANCFGCHNAEQHKGELDMTTFEKLMKGSSKEAVIEPGKPDESHMVLHLRGEEKPKMPPPGGQRRFSENAITKIEEWIKAGAKLDAGHDPKAPIRSYAATAQDLELAEFRKMTPEQRDEHVKNVGKDLWKKATKDAPEIATSKNFVLFSTMPKARADATLRTMEAQLPKLRALLGPLGLDNTMKTTLFVFKDRNAFVEFARTVENREVEADDHASAGFGRSEPYVAAEDPLHGADEPAAPRSKRSRSKKDDETPSADRTLAGVLTEQLVTGLVGKAGKAPRWVALGLGAYVASSVERGSPYIMKLRRTAYEVCEQGWKTKAPEALGEDARVDDARAVGYAIMDCIGSTSPRALSPFVNGMLEGPAKLDDVIGKVLDGTREQFLDYSNRYVMTNYGRGR